MNSWHTRHIVTDMPMVYRIPMAIDQMRLASGWYVTTSQIVMLLLVRVRWLWRRVGLGRVGLAELCLYPVHWARGEGRVGGLIAGGIWRLGLVGWRLGCGVVVICWVSRHRTVITGVNPVSRPTKWCTVGTVSTPMLILIHNFNIQDL